MAYTVMEGAPQYRQGPVTRWSVEELRALVQKLAKARRPSLSTAERNGLITRMEAAEATRAIPDDAVILGDITIPSMLDGPDYWTRWSWSPGAHTLYVAYMDVDLSGRHVGEDEPLYAIREISADVADRHELDLIRRGLSPQEAHVLVSRERGQRTVDIAERMGVTQQAVTDAARRGRVKLAALSAAKD